MTLREESVLGTERGSARGHSVENPLWNWLWTCRKTDCSLTDFRSESFPIRDSLISLSFTGK